MILPIVSSAFAEIACACRVRCPEPFPHARHHSRSVARWRRSTTTCRPPKSPDVGSTGPGLKHRDRPVSGEVRPRFTRSPCRERLSASSEPIPQLRVDRPGAWGHNPRRQCGPSALSPGGRRLAPDDRRHEEPVLIQVEGPGCIRRRVRLVEVDRAANDDVALPRVRRSADRRYPDRHVRRDVPWRVPSVARGTPSDNAGCVNRRVETRGKTAFMLPCILLLDALRALTHPVGDSSILPTVDAGRTRAWASPSSLIGSPNRCAGRDPASQGGARR